MQKFMQRIRKLPIFVCFITLTSLVSMAMVSMPVSALTAVIAAPVIVDTSLTPGSEFSIDITIAGVEKMWGHNFFVYYNTTLLTATSYDTYSPFTVLGAAYINDTAGWVFLSYNMPFGEEVGFSTVETKPLAKITFSVDAYGTSALDIQKTTLADVDANEIPREEIDGYFSNMHTNYEYLAKYNDLLADYNTLNSTYHSLLAEYNNLQTNYEDLNTEHNSLNSSYNNLQNSYQSLQNDYNDLNEQHEFLRGELSVFRNLTYIFVATTIVLIGTTIYFAARRPSQKT